MNIIKSRITRALKLTLATSVYHQKQRGAGRRRGTYKNGVVTLPHAINVRVSDDLKQALDALCAELQVERGGVVRDAVTFYIGMARQEGLTATSCPTLVAKTR